MAAAKIRSSVEFLAELSDVVIASIGCDAMEIWLKEKKGCSCWEATKCPSRFYRMGNADEKQLQEALQKGVVKIDLNNTFGLKGFYNDCVSVVSIPLCSGDETVGLLLLKSRGVGFFDERIVDFFDHVSQVIAISIAYHRVQLQQRERVKELQCLFEIAKTASIPGLNGNRILEEIVGHIPPAWQYPEITAAQIMFENEVFSIGDLSKIKHSQQADIVMEGVRRGQIIVSYMEDRPELDEGPFLWEERGLIDTIAREIASILERKKADHDRVELHKQLIHADRLATIGQLAAGVAHEINEPLGSILGFAQLASKHPDLPGQVKKDLKKIEAASLHAREVVKKLMLFARESLTEKKQVDLNELIEEGLYFIESRCVKAGIQMSKILDSNLPHLRVDPAHIHQVLINLIVNAIQAMESNGLLTIETFREDDHVCFAVRDNGCGMDDDVLEKIFIPFFTTKDVGEGTGLGLPVVHGIVSSHGGTIGVETKIGCGSRFIVRLPIHGLCGPGVKGNA